MDDIRNIGKLLDEEIVKTLEVISKTTDPESAAYRAAMRKLELLHKQRIEEADVELKRSQERDADLAKMNEIDIKRAELDLKVKQAAEEIKIKEAELAAREAELAETRKSRWFRTVLDVLGIAVPTAATGYWMYKGMKFEEEGKIYSSRTGRWISEHFRLFGKKG